ncbi:MAG: tRNA pseudouridine(55) synthase TruB [Bacteroidetes bacterium]|nr:tRNA pseudouridine(55) synthase TruB [Bacteroidota bacterium]
MNFDFYNGELLLVDKPYKWSSFQAVNKIKYLIKNHSSLLINEQKIKPKIGHAGTLDPLATGLLLVCTGKKTKLINEFMGLEKEYTGTFFIGATTPCFDLEKPIDKTFNTAHITSELILNTSKQFTGSLKQVPPIFSAVMVNGRRAYEIAREGGTTELKERDVVISDFEITNISFPLVNFKIVCSKGTYIRSIARDFGLALNSGAHLTELRRTRIGHYLVTDAMPPTAF